MKIIVGLGDPGRRYQNTRHNLGFLVLEAVAEKLGAAFDREKYDSQIAEARSGRDKVLLLKPQTFMNRSGESVAKAARNRLHDPVNLLVVTDDINLPLGRLRVRRGGSAGGHNGLKSIIERLGTRDFPRLRLGVGDERDSSDLADHVLSTFRPEERKPVEAMIERAVDATLCFLTEDVDAVMNRYNRQTREDQ